MTVDDALRAQQFMVLLAKYVYLFIVLLAEGLGPGCAYTYEVDEGVVDREAVYRVCGTNFFASEARYRLALQILVDALMAKGMSAL